METLFDGHGRDRQGRDSELIRAPYLVVGSSACDGGSSKLVLARTEEAGITKTMNVGEKMDDKPITHTPVANEPFGDGRTPIDDESDFDQGRRLKWGAVIFFAIFVVAEAPYVLESFIGTMTPPPAAAGLGSSHAARGMQ